MRECKDVGRVRCAEGRACQRVQEPPPLSLRGAKRRGNPYSLRQGIAESSTLGEYERGCGFARSRASLPGFSAGKRIATPVCALVRNDMLKTGRCQRLQGRLARGVCRRRWHVSGCKDAFRQYTGSAPLQPLTRIFLQHVIARSEATWQSVLLAAGHSGE